MKRYLKSLYRLLKYAAKNPNVFAKRVNIVPDSCSANSFSSNYTDHIQTTIDPRAAAPATNPLWEYFQNHKEGRGIWKFNHYFDIYLRHFARFVDQKVNVLEIGVYSGGSLEMWRSYFGEKSHIYGVDIEEACKVYENDHTSILIGDQGDRAFWSTFRKSAPGIDILIDDGGHSLEQQQITLEEMLPYLRPGGVYLCEDVCTFNHFAAFAAGLAQELNNYILDPIGDSNVSRFQASIHSIHFYPYVVVIEKHLVPPTKFSVRKHGTQWQPFL